MNNKKGLGIIGAGLLALAGLVGGGLYLHNKKSKEEETEQETNAENVDDESNVEE